MILVIDNYDSFTWNLVDILRRGPEPVVVYRNDEIELTAVRALNPKGILISPGPGTPADSGISQAIVHALAGEIPLLGICLGHQLLGEAFGLRLRHADAPVHGKTSRIRHDGKGVFRGLPQDLKVMRYHSLLLEAADHVTDVEVSATTATGEVMGIRHKILNFAGVQFHPESILTEQGDRIIQNWLDSLEKKTWTSKSNAKAATNT